VAKESRGEILADSFRRLTKEERTVEILRGDFTKFRELSDLAEVQGGYSEKVPKGLKLRRGRAVRSTRDLVSRGLGS
jgi:hypothetical protein